MILTWYGDGQFATYFGPVPIIFFALATWIPFGSGMVYLGTRFRVPLFGFLVALAFLWGGLDCNDNHPIRHLEPHQTRGPPDFNQAFDQWLTNRPDFTNYSKKQKYPVFLVSAEGGGLRTAYSTAIALSIIQDHCPAFAEHLFAISGVSGGSLGASVFCALCVRYATNASNFTASTKSNFFETTADAILSRDLLSPLLAKGAYLDVPQRFFPFPVPAWDRATALEVGLEHAWQKASGCDLSPFTNSFYTLSSHAQERPAPFLLMNTTLVETGERLVVGNLTATNDGFGGLEFLSAVDPNLDLSLSTAACLSARFPVFTPVAYHYLEQRAKIRLADGGYFENSGTATLTQMYHALQTPPPELKDYPYQLVVIEVGSPFKALSSSNPNDFPRAFGEIMSILRAFLNARGARAALAVEVLRTTVGRDEPIMFELNEGAVKLPLGWLLSSVAREDIRKQFETKTNFLSIARLLTLSNAKGD